MKRGNHKTRKAWKQDACRRSHGSAPMGHGRYDVPRIDTRMNERSFASVLVALATSMFSRRGNR